MKCYVCSKAAWDGFNLYRQNPKGEIGVWACVEHTKPVEAELVEIVELLSEANRSKT